MSKIYVKSEEGYEEPSEFDEKKLKSAMKNRRGNRKVPTSVALDPDLVKEIKQAAEKRGLPYQVLLRMFIVDGFNNWRKAG